MNVQISMTNRPKSLAARIEALRDRHRILDGMVVEEQGRPCPDLMNLQTLKRRRLRLRDEIASHEGILRTLERVRARPN